MKKFLEEFKAFALKGNVLDLAVGVIIGAAFQNVVNALVNGILSPILGLVTGQNFDSLQLNVIGVEFKYGLFITAVINFVIMAFVVFLIVRGVNQLTKLGHHEAPKAPTTKKCPYCLTEINIAATRCPACTSPQPDAKPAN